MATQFVQIQDFVINKANISNIRFTKNIMHIMYPDTDKEYNHYTSQVNIFITLFDHSESDIDVVLEEWPGESAYQQLVNFISDLYDIKDCGRAENIAQNILTYAEVEADDYTIKED